MKVKATSGFTLIELILVIAITLILVSVASPVYGTFLTSTQLNESSVQITQMLREARNQAISRVGDSSYGVFFATDSSTLYKGDSYATRDTNYDYVFVLDDGVSLSTTLSGNEVSYSKGLGEPNNTGTITVTHSTTGSRVIEIGSFGTAEIN